MKRYVFTVVCMLMALSMAAQIRQQSGAPANVVAVDLGLPSGTRWANVNVGASSPEEYGEYFAWGETEVKEEYNWSNYSHCDGSSESCSSLEGNICGTQYDVAHVKWGGIWRMPTYNEIIELVDNSTCTVTELNSVQVMKLTGPNGNYIYLPFTGYMDGTERRNIGYDSGYYWSGENPYTNFLAPCMVPSANGNTYYDYLWDKCLGLPVRPVINVKPSVPRTFIDLGLPSGTKWANMNIGSSRPEEYGKYFAWGETLPKNSYSWENYLCPESTCGMSGDPVFDFVGDKADIAGTKFDAATVNWGTSWNMPTAKQVEELASNCYSSLVTVNGIQCRKLTSRINGNEIIFPLAGARWFEDFAYEGTLCYYWSSTLREGGYVSPGRLIVEDDRHGWGWSMGGENDRFCGFPIRPVFVENISKEDTIAYQKFSVAFNEDGIPEMLGSGVRFQSNGNSDSYSLLMNDQQGNESTFDISKISYITRKSQGQFSLPNESGLSENDITITVDGDTVSMDNNGNYDAIGSTLMATNTEGEIVYMNIASVEDGTNAVGADLNAKESALTLMLPLVPNIFVAFDDEYLPKLKEMIWDVEEVKQLAVAIDRSVTKYGYTDFGEISKEANAARNKISQLLHLDKLAEKYGESVSSSSRKSMLKASGSSKSPYIVNTYGYAGLQVEITDSEKKQFYIPYTISGYNCEVTAYNNNRFAYSSMVKGKYDAETNTYYIPDLGNDYEYYKNILKPQKVSTFMETFTSFKYEDLERLGQFLEESRDVLIGDIGVGDMHWSDEKKTANFDISEQDDAIVLLFPRGNKYMLVYNIFQSIVKPIVKFISKKLSKKYDSEVIIPVLCGGMASDMDYIFELESTLVDPNLRADEKIEKITSLTWTKFFKALDKSLQGDIDDAIKESFTGFVDETVMKVGGIEKALEWTNVKATFKVLDWIKKLGDILTGVLGLFFEDNAVYPINWDANGQFVLAENAVTVGEGEDINVRIIVGNNSYRCESSDDEIATVTGSNNKVKIHGVDAGDAVITVRDKVAQKTAKINVHVTGIQTFVLAESKVSVPMYKDCSVTIERGDGPFHIRGGNDKIAVAKLGGGNPMFFPGDKYAIVISGVSEGSTTFEIYNEATDQSLPLEVNVTAEQVNITDERIVDLGLSVNWANCNVGASSPEEYGDYFAWGEVESKEYFTLNNYKYFSNDSFKNIGSDISGTEYDAATHNMGDIWRIPTKAEYEELISKCEWKFVTYRRARGWKVTGPNGNSIFLPAAGYMLNDWYEDTSIDGFYWSSNITDNHREVYTLFTTMDNFKMYHNYMNRFEGRTIRAVTGAKGEENPSVQTETFTINGVSFTMIGVEGGTFWMGMDSDEPGATWAEKPRHQVELSDFAIGETEVTAELFEAVSNQYSYLTSGNYPAQVSAGEALEFIAMLNALTGRSFRLPTEAEWEYAASGGKYSHGYKYAGSDDINEVAWYEGNSREGYDYIFHPVAQKKPNELGLYDMSGNVEEWCKDYYYYDYNSISSSINPCNLRSTWEIDLREIRGGMISSRAVDCTVKKRNYGSTGGGSGYGTGFRLVLTNEKVSPNYPCPDTHHPHMIDLGLPSGTKWACCNVGASKPEEYGGYYAWGEIEEKDDYSWNTYEHCDGSERTCHDLGSSICGTQYDVAYEKWGNKWQMPSKEQVEELFANCTHDVFCLNGVIGKVFLGPNYNAIFLPFAGRYSGKKNESNHSNNNTGNYWSGTPDSNNREACKLYIYSDGGPSTWYRNCGLSIRPVKNSNADASGHQEGKIEPGDGVERGDNIGDNSDQGGSMRDE